MIKLERRKFGVETTKFFFFFLKIGEKWTLADIYEGANRGEYQGAFHFFSELISWLSFPTGFQNFF